MNTTTKPPHRFVTYRYGLLLVAIGAWGVPVAMSEFRERFSESTLSVVFGLAGLVFVWANGLFWWVMFRYPRIEIQPGQFASYSEWTGKKTGAFFACYWIAAVLISIACIRVSIHA